ncbi:MAG: uncharacterized protein JWR19_3618 [Pedosphaera sp.]|nr:uncharacterized protein [Pedosphaera sp.]
MSDYEVLVLVLVAVYCWECVYWLRRGTVAFLNYWGDDWRLAHPTALLGNQGGGFVFANPFPFLGTFLTSSQSPLSISPEGVYSHVAQCINPDWRPTQAAIYFPFAGIKAIKTFGKEIRIEGKLLLKTGSAYQAEHLVKQLRRVAGLPLERRAGAIREMLRESLNIKAIQKLLAESRSRVAALRGLGNLLLVYLFGFIPFVVSRIGLRGSWIELLAGLLLLTTTTAIYFHYAHRRFYPEADDERLTHFCMILLSPATCIRAHDAFTRPMLEAFHPLAVARVLLKPEPFRAFARRVLLEIRHPCLPICPTDAAGPQATERAAREALQEAVEKFLKQNEINPEELTRPPAPTDETCRSFCPRCGAQFTATEGVCADCGGLGLVRF